MARLAWPDKLVESVGPTCLTFGPSLESVTRVHTGGKYQR